MPSELLGHQKARTRLNQPVFNYSAAETSVDPDGVLVHHFVAETVTMPKGYGTRPCATAADYQDNPPRNPTNRSRRSAGLF
jgi:hypothetical protein